MENVNPFEVTQVEEAVVAPPRLQNDFVSIVRAGCAAFTSNFPAVAGVTLIV